MFHSATTSRSGVAPSRGLIATHAAGSPYIIKYPLHQQAVANTAALTKPVISAVLHAADTRTQCCELQIQAVGQQARSREALTEALPSPVAGGPAIDDQPAMMRAHSLAFALSSMPRNSRRSSTAATNSPPLVVGGLDEVGFDFSDCEHPPIATGRGYGGQAPQLTSCRSRQ